MAHVWRMYGSSMAHLWLIYGPSTPNLPLPGPPENRHSLVFAGAHAPIPVLLVGWSISAAEEAADCCQLDSLAAVRTRDAFRDTLGQRSAHGIPCFLW